MLNHRDPVDFLDSVEYKPKLSRIHNVGLSAIGSGGKGLLFSAKVPETALYVSCRKPLCAVYGTGSGSGGSLRGARTCAIGLKWVQPVGELLPAHTMRVHHASQAVSAPDT